jgi:hypothetical protein
MRFLPFILLVGCVTVAEPIAWSQGHVSAARQSLEIAIPRITAGTEAAERAVEAIWHLDRAQAWTSAALEHVGAPPYSPEIPRGPSDYRRVMREDSLREEWTQRAEEGREIKAGLMGLLGAGGGVGGLAGIIFMLKRRYGREVMRLMTACQQYDDGVEKLPPEYRRQVKLGPEAVSIHAEIDNERKGNPNV